MRQIAEDIKRDRNGPKMIDPMDYETIKAQRERIMAYGAAMMRSDHRFRQLVDSTVASVMQANQLVDPERADEEAHDRAREATTLLLARIYTEDAEIMTLRMERDHYRKLAEKSLFMAAPSFVIPAAVASDRLCADMREAALREAAQTALRHADQEEDTSIGRRTNETARAIADEIYDLFLKAVPQ